MPEEDPHGVMPQEDINQGKAAKCSNTSGTDGTSKLVEHGARLCLRAPANEASRTLPVNYSTRAAQGQLARQKTQSS